MRAKDNLRSAAEVLVDQLRIHGVQHVFHPPAWLERWPSADRTSRMVFITRRIPRHWVEVLLDAIAAEVDDVSAASSLYRD